MAALDHLIFTSADLATGVDLIQRLTGATLAPGGPHPGVGAHNALASFDDETYFEVIAIDPGQPDPARARPFRLDQRLSPRLAGFAIHPTDDDIGEIAATMAIAGFDPGPVASMSRKRPDGALIEWQLTRSPSPDPMADGCLPFIIDWGDTETPARSTPRLGSLVGVEVQHPDAAVRDLAQRLDLGLAIGDGPARLAATIETANGVVELSSDG